MFSLHIDTARTWRGGQNQVLVTVMGLRALGHRTMLVAHSGGELRQRADEGLDLIPLAPKTEMDLSAAWRLSRIIKQLKPDIVHAHDPHGVAMAALALSMSTQLAKPPLVAARRVDFHLRSNSLSRWKYRQVDCFICASEAIRQMLVADGVPDVRGGDGPRGHRPRPRRRRAAGEPARGAVAAAPGADRRQRRRARAAQGAASSDRVRDRSSCRRCPMRGSSLRAKESCGRRSNARSRSTTSRSTCCLAGFRPDVLSVHKAFDIFA